MLKETVFIKQLTCFKYDQFLVPRINKAGMFDLPFKAVIHYLSDSDKKNYPYKDDISPFIKQGSGFLFNQGSLTANLGTNGKGPVPASTLINGIKKNVNYLKPTIDLRKTLVSDMMYGVCNYGLLPVLVKYKVTPLREWYQWVNTRTTLWDTVDKLATGLKSIQIIPVELPNVIPSVDEWFKCNKIKQIPLTRLNKIWTDTRMLDLLDIWRFFGSNRSISNLDQLQADNYDRVYLCFKLYNGSIISYSLQTILSYLKVDDEAIIECFRDGNFTIESFNSAITYALEANNQFDPDMLQRRLFKLFSRIIMLNNELASTSSVSDELEVDEPLATPSTIIDQELTNTTADKTNKEVKETITDRINRLKAEKLKVKAEESKITREYLLPTFKNEIDDTFINKLQELSFDIDERLNATTLVGLPPILIPSEEDEIQENDVVDELNRIVQGNEQDELSDDAEDDELVSIPTTSLDSPSIFIDKDRPSIEQTIIKQSLDLMNKGVLSGNEVKRKTELAKRYLSIPSPYRQDETLAQLATINQTELNDLKVDKFPDVITIPDKSMLEDTLGVFEKDYITKYLDKHIASMVLHFQNAGIIITGYESNIVTSASGAYQHIVANTEPVLGVSTPIHLKIPVIKTDGTYMAGGSRYRLKNQRASVPIRKVNSHTVMMSTYRGEMTVNRGGLLKLDYISRLITQIRKRAIDNPDSIKYINEDVFENNSTYPRDYSGLSTYFSELQISDIKIYFESRKIKELFPELENLPNKTLVGYYGDDKNPLYMTNKSELIVGDTKLGKITEILNIKIKDIPHDQASLRINNKLVPMALVLCYYYGIYQLLEVLGIDYKVVEKPDRNSVSEGVIYFANQCIVYDITHRYAIILNSFQSHKAAISKFKISDFENTNLYTKIFKEFGYDHRTLNKLKVLLTCYIDPISKDRLELMGEPSEFKLLLIRASEMLATDYYPDTYSLDAQIIRGYERIPGMVYNVMADAVERYYNGVPTKRSKIIVDNYAVWEKITTDPTTTLIEDINPVHSAKEKEAVTYTGFGGRSKETMNRESRIANNRDRGVISEASKDSGDVGIETVMSHRPNIDSFYGFTKSIEEEGVTPSSLCSTTMLLSPYSDLDD